MAIIEALSMGVPVIATPVGGVPEAIVQGESGLLVSRSTEALVEAIKVMIHDRGRWQTMSANARRVFKERFEISQVVTAYDNVYRTKP